MKQDIRRNVLSLSCVLALLGCGSGGEPAEALDAGRAGDTGSLPDTAPSDTGAADARGECAYVGHSGATIHCPSATAPTRPCAETIDGCNAVYCVNGVVQQDNRICPRDAGSTDGG